MEHKGSDIGGPTLRKIYHPAGVIREAYGVYCDLCVSRAEAHAWMDAQEQHTVHHGYARPSALFRPDAPPAWQLYSSSYIGATRRHTDKDGQLSRYASRHSPLLPLNEGYSWVVPLPTRIEINL